MTDAQIKQKYQTNPIMLTGGLASNLLEGMMPLNSVLFGTQSTSQDQSLDDAFAAFNVLPGGTLISQSIGKYPFANQTVAANATIQEPLTVSVIMDTPMRGPNAFQKKLAMFTKLQQTLKNHNMKGGTYTLVTPAFQYNNLILVALTDNSRGNTTLPQNAWRFDFERPLVSGGDLQGAQNQYTQRITNQVPGPTPYTGPQPGLSAGNAALSKTTKTIGGTTGETMQPLMNRVTPLVRNFPAMPSPASFPFTGIA